MPYKLSPDKLTVLDENGKPVGKKHNTTAQALAHLRALETNVPDAGGKSFTLKSGARHSASDQQMVQTIHDHATTLGANCDAPNSADMAKSAKQMMNEMMPDSEPEDIRAAASAIMTISPLLDSEGDEPDDLKKICDTLRGLCDFIMSEITEAEGGNESETTMTTDSAVMNYQVSKRSSIAVPTYIKSLHLSLDEQRFKDVLAAKFIGRDEIKHYVFLWGDPNKVDLDADFFTSKSSSLGATDFWDGRIGMPKPLTWNHAQDRTLMKGTQLIGDTAEYHDDEIGRFANSVLQRSHAYRKVIDDMISKRSLGTSSDSAPQYVVRERQKNGSHWIKEWAWFASALTDVPCEPRMLDIGNPIWKTIGVDAKWMEQRIAQAGLGSPREEMQNTFADYELLKLHV